MLLSYKLILVISCFLIALITGLLYAYSCSINIGLGKLNDLEYLRSMQSINRAILNPLFFFSFMGTLLVLPICLWMQYRSEGSSPNFYLMLTATLFYLIGVFGVTMFGNVPLNNSLERLVVDGSDSNHLRQMRSAFEQPWNRFHSIRTFFSAAGLLCALTAAIVKF